jgi:hypothetical protein
MLLRLLWVVRPPLKAPKGNRLATMPMLRAAGKQVFVRKGSPSSNRNIADRATQKRREVAGVAPVTLS